MITQDYHPLSTLSFRETYTYRPSQLLLTESYLDLSNDLPTLSAYFASFTPILMLALTRCLGQRLFFKTDHSHSQQYTWLNRDWFFPFCFFVLLFPQCRYLPLISPLFVSGCNESIHPCQRQPIAVSFAPILCGHNFSCFHLGSRVLIVLLLSCLRYT